MIFHNMQREARRTLYSLSASYQTGLISDDYEVIAIDNGSSEPLDPQWVRALGPQFSYHFFATDAISPVAAVNHGMRLASGKFVALVIDGARMATPGLVARTQEALTLFPDGFVSALSWHLGPKVQNESMMEGYDQAEEDRLLDSINWPEDGYRLFDISTIAQSSASGFLEGIPPECSWWAMRKATYFQMGGFDERFRSAGGGLVNHEFRERVVALPNLKPVAILGEGVFHQFHGGTATNVQHKDHPFHKFKEEYKSIVGLEFKPTPARYPYFLGTMTEACRKFIRMPIA